MPIRTPLEAAHRLAQTKRELPAQLGRLDTAEGHARLQELMAFVGDAIHEFRPATHRTDPCPCRSGMPESNGARPITPPYARTRSAHRRATTPTRRPAVAVAARRHLRALLHAAPAMYAA